MARLSHGLAVLGAWVLVAAPAFAQQNLEAGKSAAQIFSSTCSACHKTSRGLLKSVPASSLKSFLRQHYTTSTGMAEMLAVYVASGPGGESRAEPSPSPRGKKGGLRGEGEEQASAPESDGDGAARAAAAPGRDTSADAPKEAARKSSTKGKKGRETETAEKPASSTQASKPADAAPAGAPDQAKSATTAASDSTGATRTGAFAIPDVPLPPPVTSSKVTVSAIPPRKTDPKPE